MKKRNKFNRVKKENNPENYKRTYYLKRRKGGGSNPLIGMAYKLQHLNKVLGYTGEDGDSSEHCDDTWQAMSPDEIKKLEQERQRLIEILTPIRLEYNQKHFTKTFHKEEENE